MGKSKYFRVTSCTVLLAGLLAGCAAPESKLRQDASADDAKITANVKALLERHPDLAQPNTIDVTTHDHVVYLSGLDDTEFQTEEAEAIARRVPGVVRVESAVAVDQ
jgi:osmotically-inducible protein OsmY